MAPAGTAERDAYCALTHAAHVQASEDGAAEPQQQAVQAQADGEGAPLGLSKNQQKKLKKQQL